MQLLALWLLVDGGEDLFEAGNLLFGFTFVLLESGFQVGILGGFRHLGQRREDFLFGVIDVFQRIVEEVVELLGFFCHGVLLSVSQERLRTP